MGKELSARPSKYCSGNCRQKSRRAREEYLKNGQRKQHFLSQKNTKQGKSLGLIATLLTNISLEKD